MPWVSVKSTLLRLIIRWNSNVIAVPKRQKLSSRNHIDWKNYPNFSHDFSRFKGSMILFGWDPRVYDNYRHFAEKNEGFSYVRKSLYCSIVLLLKPLKSLMVLKIFLWIKKIQGSRFGASRTALGASPFGLRPHKTTQTPSLKLRRNTQAGLRDSTSRCENRPSNDAPIKVRRITPLILSPQHSVLLLFPSAVWTPE